MPTRPRRNTRTERPIVTISQHLMKQQQRFPGATGEFSFLMTGLALATKMIQAKVRRAGLTNLLGDAGEVNVQDEVQQKLDVYANEVIQHCFLARESVGILASEENEHPMIIHHESPAAKYALIYDPLDGSSNIDVNVSVGTTFSILQRPDNASHDDATSWVLQPGNKQLAAGYVVYGSSTILVYTCGNGVHGFTLDPAIGAYVLSHEHMRMPDQGNYYSINEAYLKEFPPAYGEFLDQLRGGSLGRRYASRYIGSMVADFHRTLLRGGLFMYPPTQKHPSGKLRLQYEANPIAFIAEQAGGVAIDGERRILDIPPKDIHQRTPLLVGSQTEMQALQAYLKQ